MTENLGLKNTTKIDWAFENWCLVGLYIVMIYGVIHYCLINRPVYYYYRIKYGKLDKEYIKAYGDDYTMIRKDKKKRDAIPPFQRLTDHD